MRGQARRHQRAMPRHQPHGRARCDKSGLALAHAEGQAADLRKRAEQFQQTAQVLREEAAQLQSEAEALRAGRRLPLPRPEWAGPGDDGIALGTALDWQPMFDGAHERSLLEAALAASGLLGASLGEAGASSRTWSVHAHGPVVSPNLSEALTVDVEHPLASLAAKVLDRVRLAPSAREVSSSKVTSELVIGGTVRSGWVSSLATSWGALSLPLC